MDELDLQLQELRQQLVTVLAQIERIAAREQTFDDTERDVATAAIAVIRSFRPKSLEQARAWLEAVERGEEAWIVMRSVPGENRGEAWTHETLRPHIRKQLTD